jgi:hypothetical protein
VRVAENAALGLLGGCAAALPLVLILIWRGLPTMPLAVASLAAGTLVGLFWTLIHRPTKLASAMEADRQLESADLLGSALLIGNSKGPWSDAVVAEADRWCAMHSPSAVLLNRLGARAWGGIGLATALLLVLALLPIVPSPGLAGSGDVSLIPEEGGSSNSQPVPFSRRTPAQLEPEDLQPSRIAGAAEDAQKIEQQSSSGRARRSLSDQTAGQGRGESHSEARNQIGPTALQPVGGTPDKSNTGRAAVGGADPSAGPGRRPELGAGGLTAANSSRGVPPWRSDHWDSDVDRANQAVQFGEIPDQYRDMIHGYFDRAKDR